MKFLFMCGREIDYTRNQVLLRAFKKLGDVELIVEEGLKKSLVTRSMRIAIRAFPKLISRNYNLVFVGFYGHLLMIPAGIFGKHPVLFDAFVSTFDTLTSDRQAYPPNSIMGMLAAILDRTACRLADKIILDTPEHIAYFSSSLGVATEKLSAIPVSCNEAIFFPQQAPVTKSERTRVLSYSTYLPMHGVDIIIKSASRLKDQPIDFLLIGRGPLYQSIHQSCVEMGLDNVSFLPPVPLPRIADEIAQADICLGGHFGTSDKAARVIPGKIYQMLAMRKPVIAAQTKANQTLLRHEGSAYLCPPGDPEALANAILHLHQDSALREKIAAGGREVYEKSCSESVVAEKLQQLVSELVNKN